MKIKDYTARVRAKLSDEDVAKIDSILTESESDVSDVVTESITRKKKLNEMDVTIKEKEDEIKTLKEKNDTSTLEQENQTQKETISRLLKGQRANFENRFKSISKHQRFEAVKQFYKLPEPDKDGNYDLSKMSDEDLEHNINKLAEHDITETFGKVEQPGAEGGTKKDRPDNNGGEKKIESEDDFNNAIDEEIEKYN